MLDPGRLARAGGGAGLLAGILKHSYTAAMPDALVLPLLALAFGGLGAYGGSLAGSNRRRALRLLLLSALGGLVAADIWFLPAAALFAGAAAIIWRRK